MASSGAPGAPVTKAARQAQIAAILAREQVHSQEQLAALLGKYARLHVAQATLSRDLDELGVVRLRAADGTLVYALPEEPGGPGSRPGIGFDFPERTVAAPGPVAASGIVAGPPSPDPFAAPAGPPATGGLAGLLNLLSGSSGSSFGSLLNSNLVTAGIINGTVGSGFPINLLSTVALTNVAQGFQNVGSDILQGLAEGEAGLGAPAAAGLSSALSAAGSARAPTAAMGVGVSIGKVTMPPAVVGMLAASQTPVQLASAVSPLPTGEFGLPSIPMPPFMMPPRVPAGKRKREGRDYDDIEYGLGLKGTFMTRPPSAG